MTEGRPTRARRGTARRAAVRGGAVLWIVFTVVAVVAGLAAASSVGSAISDAGAQPRTDAQIRAALGAQATTLPEPPTTPSSTPTKNQPTQSAGGHHHRPDGQTRPAGGSGQPSAPTQPGGSDPSTPRPTHTGNAGSGGNHNGGSGGNHDGGSGGGSTDVERATLTSVGGTVVASCAKGEVTLLTWSPALGYRVDGVQRGPAHEVEITFVGDNRHEVTMVITCGSDGRPHATVENDDRSGDR